MVLDNVKLIWKLLLNIKSYLLIPIGINSMLAVLKEIPSISRLCEGSFSCTREEYLALYLFDNLLILLKTLFGRFSYWMFPFDKISPIMVFLGTLMI